MATGLEGTFYGGWLAQQQANRAQDQQTNQNNLGNLGMLAKIQKIQEEQALRQALSQTSTPDEAIATLLKFGSPNAIKMAHEISATQAQLAGIKNVGITGQLHQAQLEELKRKGAVADTEQAGKQRLQQLLAPGQTRGEGNTLHQPQTFLNEDAAFRALQEAERTGTPFTGRVPPQGDVMSAAIQAGNALPRGTFGDLQKQINPQAGMTQYQRENLDLQAQRLNKPPPVRPGRVVPMPDPNNPAGAIYGVPQPGQQAFPPGAGGLLNNNTIRERQLAGQLEAVKKPHLDVLNAYQRYDEIRASGDNAQANQMLAQQIMQMSKTGQRVIPKAELERILGSGDLGNNWAGRAANMISQMAAGVRTADIDKKLNDVADAMARASADRIGQEVQNTRARTPTGANVDNIVGSKPLIYGRFIITPTGKVHTFASPEEAQARLAEAAQKMGQ